MILQDVKVLEPDTIVIIQALSQKRVTGLVINGVLALK
jgi:hypothetical protein